VKVMNECAATLAPQDAHREDIMNTFTVRLLAAVTTVLGSIWLAPASHAMLPPPDPGPGTGQTTADLSAGSGGTAWQVIGIVVIAVAIGAIGSFVAQRVRRHDQRFVNTA
jgi:hypothetical protein